MNAKVLKSNAINMIVYTLMILIGLQFSLLVAWLLFPFLTLPLSLTLGCLSGVALFGATEVLLAIHNGRERLAVPPVEDATVVLDGERFRTCPERY